ncbi:MAG TPA: precorrin-3B synthase [Acetobacteraceae bacterium]|nr:precorrin-3B synthase [Acetobacteraceae bacterium]
MSGTVAKGWCPSLYEPMRAADGLLVRVKPPGAKLGAAAARRLARAAGRFGNGAIELTSRANLQIRGLSAEGVAPFAEEIVAAGLADRNPAIERRRVVIHPPLADEDPTAARHASATAAEIETILAGDERFAGLPAKFAVAVDGGGILPLGETGADLRVICAHGRQLIAPAGAPLAREVTETDIIETVARLVEAFLDLSSRCASRPRRMRALVSEIGGTRFFAAAGLCNLVLLPPLPSPQPIGWLPYSKRAQGGFGLGLMFGALTASLLVALGELAEEYGDATLRPTPWKALILPGVAEHAAPALREKAARLGVIVEPNDPRRAVIACPGRAGCTAASVDARADAALLSKLNPPSVLHVSGCSKGCAHPGPAPVTLVGEDGRYGLIRNGRPGDVPMLRGLTMREAIDALGISA